LHVLTTSAVSSLITYNLAGGVGLSHSWLKWMQRS